jgi:ketosteroid isomerase-like protein
MKSMHLAVGLILLLLAVPVQAQTMTAVQKADIEKAVKDKVKQLYSTFDSMNAEAYVQMWSRDKIIGEMRPTGLEKNPDNMLKLFKNDYANQKSHKNDILDIKVNILSPDTVLAFGKTSLRIELTNGNIQNYNFADMSIWAKESEGWKLTHFVYAGEAKK